MLRSTNKELELGSVSLTLQICNLFQLKAIFFNITELNATRNAEAA